MNIKKMIPSVSVSFSSPLSSLAEKAPHHKIISILIGVLCAFGMILGLTLVYSLINFFTEILKPEYAAPAAMFINIFSLFCGGFLTARKSRQQGLLMGLLFACCFYLILVIIGSICGFSISNILAKCYYGIIAAAIGGICGVK